MAQKSSKSPKKQKTMAKAKGKTIAAPTTSADLTITLSEDGTRLTGTVSPNAQWAGIQKFVDPASNDGAIGIHESNRNYTTPPGEGVTTECAVQGTGYYRVFSSDFPPTYNVHVSEFLFIP